MFFLFRLLVLNVFPPFDKLKFSQDLQSTNDENLNDFHVAANVVKNGAEHSKYVTAHTSTNSSEDEIDLIDVVEPISTLKTGMESGSTLVPLIDDIMKNEGMHQRSMEIDTRHVWNDEHSFLSDSTESDASTVDNSSVKDEESKECGGVMTRHLHCDERELSDCSDEEEEATSSNICRHLDDVAHVYCDRNIPAAHSNGRTYRLQTENVENLVADISGIENFSADEEDLTVEVNQIDPMNFFFFLQTNSNSSLVLFSVNL